MAAATVEPEPGALGLSSWGMFAWHHCFHLPGISQPLSLTPTLKIPPLYTWRAVAICCETLTGAESSVCSSEVFAPPTAPSV